MKLDKLIFSSILILLLALGSCTEDFDEINTDQQGFNTDEVSAKFFLTSSQFGLYAPNRYPYWRAHLIHSDRFAGHFTFGHSSSWWNDGLSYNYSAGYTDASYDWLAGHFGNIKAFADFTQPGGDFENENMYAITLIMKGLYYQLYTETFGMVPFSEAGVEGILTPKYDAQIDIYKGIISDLDAAMATIGDTERTGIGVDDVAENDVYCGGDLQKWKRLANTLKLRIGMRALGAPGDDFATAAITSALASPLLDDESGSVVMAKDYEISKWSSSSYGDVWHDFGGGGSKWTMGSTLINLLRDNNDPRLGIYAKPAVGGTFKFINSKEDGNPLDPDFFTRVDFILGALEDAGAEYATSIDVDTTTVEVNGGQYIGQPVRINGDTKTYAKYDLFSTPGDAVIQSRGKEAKGYPEIILSNAESYFLQAEAAVRGIGSGDAQALFEAGIIQAMNLWEIPSDQAQNYIDTQSMGDISIGSIDEKLRKIALQRWIVSYTDGFEAWSVVRKTGYPTELAAGVTDDLIFALGTLNGKYPQRMRYGSGAQDNPNFSAAISEQGADEQGTTLWFAKN